jgi:hypothetical protein
LQEKYPGSDHFVAANIQQEAEKAVKINKMKTAQRD